MPSLLLHVFIAVCFLSGHVSAVTTDTVVGMAGKRVTLPCRLEAERQRGVEVCWGRGEPSVFTCHNAVVNTAGRKVTYKKSYRYTVSSSSSLTILNSRLSDAGFYHCRVQLPGPFNDQTSIIHLIIVPRVFVSKTTTKTPELSDKKDAGKTNAPRTTTGSDVTEEGSTGPMIAYIQSSVQKQQEHSLKSFIGNTVRVSFIAFIPALLLTAAYKVYRTKQSPKADGRLNQSDDEGADTYA
ncbi:hepatitis A virus cellular receptor 1-like isoform X2 [Antennarius striatus]|uniref:hepatitis A virus cellular receptor 1-like isoform X2 n=1 Tax=Antennarius striatus TaxID=241820 RepID=UPI0035B1E151